jgi:probable HAF family extracellular repeat protein
MQDLGTLGGPSSTATAINDAGAIIGNSDLPGPGTAAFMYANGSLSSLGNLGSNYSSAFALNNNGLVAGESGTSAGVVHGFVYENGTITDLGTLGGNYSSAFAVSDPGEVVGESSIGNSDIHGFVYTGGVLSDVGTLGGTYSSTYLINSNDLAVGIANTTGDLETHGFLYNDGAISDLGTLGGSYSFPNALNNKGQVVGESALGTGEPRAFLWDKGTMKDLNTLLPNNSGWELSSALYINDAGRIVGIGNFAGMSQWFIFDLASGNGAPVAVAGPDQTADCQAQVTLDGSPSTDPDNDSLVFEWSSGGDVLGTNPVLSVSLPTGTNVVMLKVTDPCGASSRTNVIVVVADITPPSILGVPAALTLSAVANCQASLPNLLGNFVVMDSCTPANQLATSQNPAPGTLLGVGDHLVTLTATDAAGNSSSAGVLVKVADTRPPSILSSPRSLTVSADANCQGIVPNVLASVIATDNCTPASQLVLTQVPAAGTVLPRGNYSVSVTVTDASGNKSHVAIPLAILDKTAPIIRALAANPGVLGPPNHQLVPVVISALVTDTCDSSPVTEIIAVTSNEPISRGDVQITGSLSVNLAASKCSSGAARTYTITVQSTDASGNCSKAQVIVSVPKSNGNHEPDGLLSKVLLHNKQH